MFLPNLSFDFALFLLPTKLLPTTLLPIAPPHHPLIPGGKVIATTDTTSKAEITTLPPLPDVAGAWNFGSWDVAFCLIIRRRGRKGIVLLKPSAAHPFCYSRVICGDETSVERINSEYAQQLRVKHSLVISCEPLDIFPFLGSLST